MATAFHSEASFLEAWELGVELAGSRFFGNALPPVVRGTAATKWDLEPNHDAIERAMGVLSSGEALFLAAMYSFYNASGAQAMYGRALVPGEIAAALDEKRRRVIADLTISYTGW